MRNIKQAIWFWKLKQNKKVLVNRKPVNYNFPLEKSARIIICMPADDLEFYQARDLLKIVSQTYRNIILITSAEQDLTAEHKGQVFHYPIVDKKAKVIHKKDMDKLPAKGVIALDLSSKPSLLSAYITATHGKLFTGGIHSAKYDKFFTICFKQGKSYQATLETLFSFLGMI